MLACSSSQALLTAARSVLCLEAKTFEFMPPQMLRPLPELCCVHTRSCHLWCLSDFALARYLSYSERLCRLDCGARLDGWLRWSLELLRVLICTGL